MYTVVINGGLHFKAIGGSLKSLNNLRYKRQGHRVTSEVKKKSIVQHVLNINFVNCVTAV